MPRTTTPPLLQRFVKRVTSGRTTVDLGIAKQPFFIYDAGVHVITGFNSDGTDLLDIGWSGSSGSIVNDLDVSTTGVKSPTVTQGLQTTSRTIQVIYTAGGSSATTGEALVYVFIFQVPTT